MRWLHVVACGGVSFLIRWILCCCSRAAHVGNLRIVDALVNYGRANLYAKDADGNTAVHHAAAQGHLWVLHFLLEVQKRVPPAAAAQESNASATTALHYACDAGT